MSALSVTASQVMAGSNADFYDGIAGVAITAGQPCYLSTIDNKLYAADANGLASARVKGVSLHGASASQPLRLQISGMLIIGAGAAPPSGTAYWLGETAGSIVPFTDLAAGSMYGTYLGTSGASNTIMLGIHATDTLLAAVV